jgi:hypothetical protein
VDFPQQRVPSKVSRRIKSVLRRMRWAWKAKPDGAAKSANTRDFRVNFDYSEVADMAEDKDAQFKRAAAIFAGNLVTLDEGREEIGHKPCDDVELGGKFWFQLAPAPAGEFGAIPGPDDPQTPPKPTPPDDDPDDDDLPEEEDEDAGEND